MNNQLYIARASRFIEADPVRGVRDSRMEYSGYHIVVASRNRVASEKLLAYLKENTRYKGWICSETKKLTAGKDVPLERRAEILGEVFPVIR